MPKAYKYRDVLLKLRDHDARFQLYERRGKGSHRILFHPDVRGQAVSYPIPYHGANKEIGKGMLKAMIRRFDLPTDFFD